MVYCVDGVITQQYARNQDDKVNALGKKEAPANGNRGKWEKIREPSQQSIKICPMLQSYPS